MTASRSPLGRRLRWTLAAVAACSVTAALPASAGATFAAKGTTWTLRQSAGASGVRVIVQARAGRESAVAAAVRAAGGTVETPLPVVNGFAARVPASAIARLKARADVRDVTTNSNIHFASNTYDEASVASTFVKNSGATTAWAQGRFGEGVGVAVIDTGISPMNDLAGARLVHGPDLSGEGSYIDNYGHGTVMSGIIGGTGADSANRVGGAYTGVAPKATLVGVKVAGRNGAADVSTMLQAMHWVSAYKDQYNIRVLNLSWGTDSTADPATDPLNYAVQRLWRQGIVVVVAAGNSGNGATTITKPADDPLVLTVGAYNEQGNLDPADDGVPSWSSRGPTAQGRSKPDFVAPGRILTAARSFGSYVEQTYPKALVSPSYIKGSGTSEAAAVTSGLAALLIEAHPDWTPDQVKNALKSTATPIAGLGATAQGAGRVSLTAALNASPGAAVQQTFEGTGLGSLEASRGNMHVYADCQQNGTWTLIQGEITDKCQPWNGTSWTGTSWTGTSWTGTSWTGTSWTGTSWTGTSWTGTSWTTAEYGDEDNLFLSAFWGARPKAGQHVNGEQSEPRQAARAAGAE